MPFLLVNRLRCSKTAIDLMLHLFRWIFDIDPAGSCMYSCIFACHHPELHSVFCQFHRTTIVIDFIFLLNPSFNVSVAIIPFFLDQIHQINEMILTPLHAIYLVSIFPFLHPCQIIILLYYPLW